LKDTEWNALSPEAQSKIIEACKKGKDDEEGEKSMASNKSSKTIKSLSKTMKSLEKDNQQLKKPVSVLQNCDEDEGSLLFLEEGSSLFQDAME
jgi:esterase/lipase